MEVTGDLGTGKCSRAVRAKGYFEVPEEEKEKKEMQINITKRNFSLPLNRPKEVKRLTMPSATERKGTRYTSFCSRPKPQAPKKLETHLPFDPAIAYLKIYYPKKKRGARRYLYKNL